MRFYGLQKFWWHYQLAYYEWALKEMDPMHPDFPQTLLRVAALTQKIRE